MTRSVARLTPLLVLSMLVPPALAFAGPQQPRESARSTDSGGHSHAARPQPHAPAATPASPFSATPSTYAPRNRISPLLRPRPSIVIGGGFAFGGDASSEATAATGGRADTSTIETPVAAPPPDVRPPDTQPPAAQAPDAAPKAAPPLAAVTLYVIPGCYAGDRPPVDGTLPAGCDVSKMRTVRIR